MNSADMTPGLDQAPSKLSLGNRKGMIGLFTGLVLLTSTFGVEISKGSYLGSEMPACTRSGKEWMTGYNKVIEIEHGVDTEVSLYAMEEFPHIDIERIPGAVIGRFYALTLDGNSRRIDGFETGDGLMQATAPFSDTSKITAAINIPGEGDCLLSTDLGVDQLDVKALFKARFPIVQNDNNSMMVNRDSKIDLGKKTTDIKRHR
ncbi:MAG: hypothetical protein WCO33_01225 [bacterium]